MKIRTVIVDDEPLARERILQLLRDVPDVEVVGECSGGLEAVDFLEHHSADLMFLDVQMPDVDGFGVLEALDPKRIPVVIFVTAYGGYAVKAFDVQALDYVLKPIDRDRFAAALARARRELQPSRGTETSGQITALLEELRKERRYLDRLVVHEGGRVTFLRVAELDYIAAGGNYLKIHALGKTHLLRGTMNRIQDRLDPKQFVRIHRSTLLNIERLRELQPYRKDEAMACLKDGSRLTVSRRYRKHLLALVNTVS